MTCLALQVLLNIISQYFINCFKLGTKIQIEVQPKCLVLQWFPLLTVVYAQSKNHQHSVTLTTYYSQLKSGKVFMSFLIHGNHAG